MQKELARIYQVSERTIRRIIARIRESSAQCG